MSIDKLINLLATVTLLEMMVMIGLGVSLSQISGVAKDVKLVTRALIGSYVLVPAVALGLLLAFRARPLVAAGFLMAAVCPGAPYGPPFTGLAKGKVPVAVGLMVVLAGLSAVLAPVLLGFMLPIVAGDQTIKADALKMLGTLLFSQFLPLCVGLAIRQKRPDLARKLEGPAKKVSTALNLLLLVIILTVQWRMLASISARGFFGMFLLVIATFVIGWILGGRDIPTRRAVTAATSIRNVGVSLVLVTGSFPGTPAVSAATAYALFQTILLAVVFLVWGKAIPGEQASRAAA